MIQLLNGLKELNELHSQSAINNPAVVSFPTYWDLDVHFFTAPAMLLTRFGIFLFSVAVAFAQDQQYDRSLSVPMGNNGIFLVRWSVTATDISFEFSASTAGWIGLGFGARVSTNLDNPDTESFKNADFYIGWVKPSTNPPEQRFYDAYIQSYIPGGLLVAKDTTPNVDSFDVRTEQREGRPMTIARFKRKLSTCDLLQDFAINASTVSLVMAFGPSAPDMLGTDPHFFYLQSSIPPRTLSVQPYVLTDRNIGRVAAVPTTSNPNAVQPWTFTIPRVLPGTELWPTNSNNFVQNTVYRACQFSVADLPAADQTIVQMAAQGIEPRIMSLKLFICARNITPVQLSEKNIPPNRFIDNCTPTGSYGDLVNNCREMVASWTNTGTDLINTFPDNTGFSMNREEYGGRYRMVEVTYSPSGAAVTGTPQNLWQFQFLNRTSPRNIGLLPIMADSGGKLLIPGQSREFLVRVFCDIQCTKKHIPSGGITLIGVQHVTSTYAIQMRTRLIRDGKEVKTVSEDFSHTSGFQPMRDIDNTQVLPGDRILVECTYNTSRTTSDLTGGYGTNNEICSAVFQYYPRIPGFQFCGSSPESRHIQALTGVGTGTSNGVPTLTRSESNPSQYPPPPNVSEYPFGTLGQYDQNNIPLLGRNTLPQSASNPNPSQCIQSRIQNLYLYHRHEPVCELDTDPRELFRVDSIALLSAQVDPQCPGVMIQRNFSYEWPVECYDIIFRDEVQGREICKNATVTQTSASVPQFNSKPVFLLIVLIGVLSQI